MKRLVLEFLIVIALPCTLGAQFGLAMRVLAVPPLVFVLCVVPFALLIGALVPVLKKVVLS